MKVYIVRKNGRTIGCVKAANLRDAERMALRRYGESVTVSIS